MPDAFFWIGGVVLVLLLFFTAFLFFFLNRKAVCVYLGLGSNQGDRENILKKAAQEIALLGEEMVISRVWESAPWGGVATEPFFNIVLSFKTKISPQNLLKKLQRIEKNFGRDRSTEEKWGNRTLDIDILFYGKLESETKTLILPHPYAHKRGFVIFPLSDIAPDFFFFQQKKYLSEVLAALSEEEKKSIHIFSAKKK